MLYRSCCCCCESSHHSFSYSATPIARKTASLPQQPIYLPITTQASHSRHTIMAPATAHDELQLCCSPTLPPSDNNSYPTRNPSSPTSLFRIDMHTHIMPPSLPDLASLTQQPPSPPPTTTNNPTQPTTKDTTAKPYPWPAFRPSPDHATTGAVDMYVGSTFFRRVSASCYDPAARLRDMDAAGVDVQVLSTVPVLFCYDAPVAPARVLARVLNDHVSGVCARFPGRFVGLGTVALQDCDAAVEEVRRLRGLEGMVGVQVGTSVEVGDEGGGKVGMLDDERLEPFWAACEELDVPVFVHPLGYALGKENKDRWGRYWSSWLVGMPCETALAMHGIMASGLLVRHPGLRLCFAHGGGAFPALLGRIQHGFDCRPDLVATNACGLEAGQGQIWIDSLLHDPDLMEYVIRKLGPGGADRIVLGSDYPFPLGEVPVAGKMLTEDEKLGRFMSWQKRAGVLARNAIRFLKLGREFEDRFEERLRQFAAAHVPSPDEQIKDASWDGWRHRDSAIDLDEGEDLASRKPRTESSSTGRSPGSVGSQ
ncbi:uncharacterized protein B0H64DRAFT_381337 [Chaetomium fimeti]|uniref:2-amino-3-carboxymuconate-6-semialdehyde decarboxylase n=1 Tax=Chaetomium fimeti TaxID=1854472 RepID=A0AAE0LXS8_9PEZI|nr:hypothetical protein B0H64DRAFT_381337 [Chaetomium fimeti]